MQVRLNSYPTIQSTILERKKVNPIRLADFFIGEARLIHLLQPKHRLDKITYYCKMLNEQASLINQALQNNEPLSDDQQQIMHQLCYRNVRQAHQVIFQHMIAGCMDNAFKEVLTHLKPLIMHHADLLPKEDILNMIENCMENRKNESAKEFMIEFLLLHKPREILNGKLKQRFDACLSQIAEQFKQVPYIKKSEPLNKQDILNAICKDVVLYSYAIKSICFESISPFNLLNEISPQLIAIQSSFEVEIAKKDSDSTTIATQQSTLIDCGFHGDHDVDVSVTHEATISAEITRSYNYSSETIQTRQERQTIGEHSQVGGQIENRNGRQWADHSQLENRQGVSQDASMMQQLHAQSSNTVGSAIDDAQSNRTLSGSDHSNTTGLLDEAHQDIQQSTETVDHEEHGVQSENSTELINQKSVKQTTSFNCGGIIKEVISLGVGVSQSTAESNSQKSRQQTSESTQNRHSETHAQGTTTGQRNQSSSSESVAQHQVNEHSLSASEHHNEQQQQAMGTQQSGTVSDRHHVDALRQNGTSTGQERHTVDIRHHHNQRSVDQAQEHHHTVSHQGNRQLGNQINHTSRESGTTTTIRKNGDGVLQVVTVDIEHRQETFFNILEFKWAESCLKLPREDDDRCIHNLHARLSNPALIRVFQFITQKSCTVKGQQLHSRLKLEYAAFPKLYDLVQSFISLRSHVDNDSFSTVTEGMITCLRTCSAEDMAGDITFEAQKTLCDTLNEHPLELTKECRIKETEQLLERFECNRKVFSESLGGQYAPLLPANKYSGQLFYSKKSDELDGFYIGARQLMRLLDSLQHMLLVGASGTGKTSCFFIPGILRLQEKNALVIDVDGTIYTQTHQAKRDDGYSIKCLDLISPESSSLFNPILNINDGAHFDKIINQCSEDLAGENKIFLAGGKALIKFAILLTQAVSSGDLTLDSDLKERLFDCENNDEICLSFPLLNTLIHRLTYDTMSQLHPIISGQSGQDLQTLITCFGNCYEMGNEFKERYSGFWTFSKNSFASFQNDVFKRVMSGQDDIFDEIKDPSKKVIVYLRVKGSDIPQSETIIGLFFDHFFKTVKDCVNLTSSNQSQRPTLCFMDEFGQYSIPNFTTEMTTVRKFNIALMLAVQSQTQISKRYKDDASTILQNCQTKVYLNFDITDSTPKMLEQATTKTIRKSDGRGGYININEPVLTEQQIRDIEPGYAVLQWKHYAPVKYELLPPVPMVSVPNAQESTLVSVNEYSDGVFSDMPDPVCFSNDELLQAFKSQMIGSQAVSPQVEEWLKVAYFSGHINHLLSDSFPIQIKPEQIENHHQWLSLKDKSTPEDLVSIFAKYSSYKPRFQLEEFIKEFNKEEIYKTHHPRHLIHIDEFTELYSYHEGYLSYVYYLILGDREALPEQIWTEFKNRFDFINDTNQLMRYFCYHIYYSIKYPQTHTQNESCWFASFDANQIETFNRWKEQATPSVEFPDDVNELRGQLFDIGALRETLLGDDFHYLGVEVWLSFDFRGIYHRNYVLNRLNYLKSHLLETAKDETFLDSVHSSDPYRLMMECTNGNLLTEHELDSYIQKLSGFGFVQEF